MNNIYYFLYALIITMSLYNNLYVKNKIQTTVNLINECMVYDSVSYYSLLDAFYYNDETYLYLNVDKLKNNIDTIIKSNLKNINYEVKYYFYSVGKESIKGYNNSVQILININYLNINYQKELRFEPNRKE